MGVGESSLKAEGDMLRTHSDCSASTVATEPEPPSTSKRLPQSELAPPGQSHSSPRSASLGHSASSGNGLNMGSDQHYASGQRRHHTWHNAPKKRVFDQSVWDLQVRSGRRVMHDAAMHRAPHYPLPHAMHWVLTLVQYEHAVMQAALDPPSPVCTPPHSLGLGPGTCSAPDPDKPSIKPCTYVAAWVMQLRGRSTAA